MTIEPSIYKVFALCNTIELSAMADKFPEHRPIIGAIIKVREPLETQKEALKHVMTCITGLHFHEIIPVISAYIGIREPTSEEYAQVKDKMDAMKDDSVILDFLNAADELSEYVPNVDAMLSRLDDNIQVIADSKGIYKSLWEVECTWEMLKEESEKVRRMLTDAQVILEQVRKCGYLGLMPNHKCNPPMPEGLKCKKIELLCSGDNAVFEMEAKAAWEIGIIRNLIECAVDIDLKVEMPGWITSDNLKLMIEFCKSEVSRKDDGDHTKQMEIGRREIFDLHKIADYLLIESLLDWTAGLIADMINNTGEEIVRILGLIADMINNTGEEIVRILDLDTGIVREAAAAATAQP